MNETSDSMNLKKVCLNVLSVSAVLFLLWAAVFGTLEPMYQMGIGMLLVFVYSFLKKPVQLPGSFKWVARIIDTIFIAIGSICIVYVIIFAEDLSWRLGNPTTIDLTVGTLGTIIILEFCRRTKNIPLAILGIFFALYALMGSYIPGEFGNSGFSVQRIVRFVWLSSEGVWGSITMLVAKVLLMFVFWGSLLQVTGAADFFMRLAFVLTRKVKSGPCLSAVVASSLVGTVVGSSTGNVVTTGPITIPCGGCGVRFFNRRANNAASYGHWCFCHGRNVRNTIFTDLCCGNYPGNIVLCFYRHLRTFSCTKCRG